MSSNNHDSFDGTDDAPKTAGPEAPSESRPQMDFGSIFSAIKDSMAVMNHPLMSVYNRAVLKAINGNGTDHPESDRDFFDRSWVATTDMHGTGYLTGSAEAALHKSLHLIELGEHKAAIGEMLESMNFIGMAVLKTAAEWDVSLGSPCACKGVAGVTIRPMGSVEIHGDVSFKRETSVGDASIKEEVSVGNTESRGFTGNTGEPEHPAVTEGSNPYERVAESLRLVQDKCFLTAFNAGWWHDLKSGDSLVGKRNVGELIALMHSELSEGLEGHRKGLMDDKLPHRPMVEVEMADTIIRILDAAEGMGWDVPGAVAEKLAYNATRADHRPENRAAEGGKKI